MPFEQAARMLGALLGVQISEETARRLAEQVGNWMEAAQRAEATTASPDGSREEPALPDVS